jgi:pSer/pThr/pTyr-binding forkhead associated (FHA) protein
MQNENSQIVMEHQLIIQDEKGCRTYFLEHSTYEIGKSCKLPIRLCTQSRLVAPHHATLLRVGQQESFHYQLLASFPQDDSGQYQLLVNGNPIQIHDLQDGDAIAFVPGVSATYRYSHRLEPLPVNFPEGLIDFSFYGLGNLS